MPTRNTNTIPTSGTYLMVLPVPCYRTAEGRFATESAFVEHLRLLRKTLGDEISALVVASPFLDDAGYEKVRPSFLAIDEAEEGIFFVPLHAANAGHASFLKRMPSLLGELYREVGRARVVHSGPSFLYRPVTFASLVLGAALGKVTISVTDIDNRESALMNRLTGRWSSREYWTTRLVHHTSDHLQHLLIAEMCSLVLLKGKQLADDYGRDKANVKNFLDSAYGSEHLIGEAELERKMARLSDPKAPLRFTFYGRLVPYKGVDHMLRSFAIAARTRDFDATFDVYGDGPERESLTNLSRELGLEKRVTFHGAKPFGSEFFATLRTLDVLLACPLSQDTPRSALDAQASGQLVLAYDTYYYKDLAAQGAAIEVVPWRDERALAERLIETHRNRPALARALRRGAEFAQTNTQEEWLARRFAWTLEALGASPHSTVRRS